MSKVKVTMPHEAQA